MTNKKIVNVREHKRNLQSGSSTNVKQHTRRLTKKEKRADFTQFTKMVEGKTLYDLPEILDKNYTWQELYVIAKNLGLKDYVYKGRLSTLDKKELIKLIDRFIVVSEFAHSIDDEYLNYSVEGSEEFTLQMDFPEHLSDEEIVTRFIDLATDGSCYSVLDYGYKDDTWTLDLERESGEDVWVVKYQDDGLKYTYHIYLDRKKGELLYRIGELMTVWGLESMDRNIPNEYVYGKEEEYALSHLDEVFRTAIEWKKIKDDIDKEILSINHDVIKKYLVDDKEFIFH